MKLKFCGAARGVTGSCHLITVDNGYKILLDCGMFQGDEEDKDRLNAEWTFDPSEIDILILSHAHIDHCGRIPLLVKDGFKGHIVCTHATRDLAEIMLSDTAYIQERDAVYQNKKNNKKRIKQGGPKQKDVQPLYRIHDVKKAMQQFVSVSYNRWVELAKGIKLLFTDAGHILGSASINLVINRGGDDLRLGFSGDIGRPQRPILRDPQEMWPADMVITESTYGDKLHVQRPAEKEQFRQIIHETCVERKGKLIIPAFSLGRTQELVYIMDQLCNEGKLPNIPVYVDSPLAVNATDIFKAHSECFDDELLEYIRHDPDPFGFRKLFYIIDANESKKLNSSKEPCIIVSAAGMVNAGRIQHHVFNNIQDHRNTILMVGYCPPGTPGGKLRARNEYLKLFGETLKVNASIEIMDSFSAHGDQNEMLDFLANQKTVSKKLFLVHGDYDVQQAYSKFLANHGFNGLEIPDLHQEFKI